MRKISWSIVVLDIGLSLMFLFTIFTLYIFVHGLDPSNFFKTDIEIERQLVDTENEEGRIRIAEACSPNGFKQMYQEVLLDLQNKEAFLKNEQKRRRDVTER